jgi:hypothetical protein
VVWVVPLVDGLLDSVQPIAEATMKIANSKQISFLMFRPSNYFAVRIEPFTDPPCELREL